MSLINDALKKAQKQRTGDAPPLAAMPGVGGQTAARIAKRAKPAGFNALLLRLGLGAGALLVVLVVGGYFGLRKAPEDRTPKTDNSMSQTATTVARSDPTYPSSVVRPPSSEPQTPVAFSLPVTALPATSGQTTEVRNQKPDVAAATPLPAVGPTPVGQPAKAPASPVAKLPADQPPPAGAAATPPIALKMDGKAVAFIETLRIAGIRASATDSKVLMNDRVYRMGDMVEHEMGLKLVGITSSSLSFEDERGARYTRNF